MKAIQFSLLVLTLFVATSAVSEQTWFVRTWQSDEGLPDNTVVGIDQTPDGFLWVATYTGLVRFDGVQFREFPLRLPGIKTGHIRDVCADRRGRVWVARDPGVVVCLEQGKLSAPVTPREHAPSGGPRRVVEDGEGAVWVSHTDGTLLRIKEGKVRAYRSEEVLGQPAFGAIALTVDPLGQLWFCAEGLVGVFRAGRFVVLGKVPPAVKVIFVARGGGVWLASDTSLLRYTESGGLSERITMNKEITRAELITCLEDRSGRIWIGTRFAGLFCLDGTEFQKVEMSHQPLLCLKEDREGTLWAATRGGGLKQVTPKVAELMTTSESLVFGGIQSICKDAKGQLWAINWNQGKVLREVDGAWLPLSHREGWTIPFATCVAAEPRGGIWIGTQGDGVFLWQDGAFSRHFSITNGLAGNQVGAIRTTPAGAVWIGVNPLERVPKQAFLQCWTKGQFQTFTMPSESGAIMALEVDASGDCWSATSSGHLLRVRGTRLTDETHTLLPDPFPIRTLLATPDNSLWIGFGGRGLGRLKEGRFTHCRREQGLSDDYISQILSDGQGRLWLAGNRGLFSVREKDWEAFAEGREPQLHSVAFKKKDGVPGLIASFDAWPDAFRDIEGRLYFAMQSGVVTLYPDAIRKNPLPPKVVIDRVSANGKAVALYGAIDETGLEAETFSPVELGQAGAALQLPLGRRQVEVYFTAPAFSMAESIRFKYRLQGLDKEWVEAGAHRSVLYSQLAPGHYTFQVIACNRDGVWNEQGASLDVTVPHFWWETVWFRVGGSLLAVGLVGCWLVLGLRRRYRHKLERMALQQATEKERVRISRDLHDDLGAGLTQISLVNALIQKGAADAEKVRVASSKVNEIMSGLVRSLDEIVWAVNPRNDTFDGLVTYLGRYAEEFLKVAGLRCRLDLPLDVPAWPVAAKVRHGLFLAFKETLNNASKHSAASVVRISVRTQGDGFELLIEDDGQGFKTEQGERAGRSGLANIRSRLAEIGGSCVIESDIGKGTCVRFRMAERAL